MTAQELDRSVRAELRSLSSVNAEQVARHLVMAGRLVDDEPELAWEHAAAASARAGRIAAVREAAGVTAYAAGLYADALRELRAASRMSGSVDLLPLIADCERGLGRPERALALASSPEAGRLDVAGRVELRIVAAGARRDLGQLEAAVVTLQCRELTAPTRAEWVARLRYAYADALLAVGREDEALRWFERAADADVEGATDAGDRVVELSGLVFEDLDDEDGEDDEDGDDEDGDDLDDRRADGQSLAQGDDGHGDQGVDEGENDEGENDEGENDEDENDEDDDAGPADEERATEGSGEDHGSDGPDQAEDIGSGRPAFTHSAADRTDMSRVPGAVSVPQFAAPVFTDPASDGDPQQRNELDEQREEQRDS